MAGTTRRVRWLPVLTLGLALGAVGVVLVVDQLLGGALARWAAEYEGGGSCAWRGERGRAFQALLVFAALPAYPLSLTAAAAWAREAARAPTPRARGAAVALALLGVALLAVLVWKGAASAALERC